MNNHTTEVLVGSAVLAVAVAFLVYASQVTGVGGREVDASVYTASFTSVEGVSVGTDVRMGGVKVGTVTDLVLNPQSFRAETTFTVDRTLPLPEDTAVVIASEGLLGGNFVELKPGGSPFNLEPGGEILDTQSSISLITLLLRFVTGGDEGSQ